MTDTAKTDVITKPLVFGQVVFVREQRWWPAVLVECVAAAGKDLCVLVEYIDAKQPDKKQTSAVRLKSIQLFYSALEDGGWSELPKRDADVFSSRLRASIALAKQRAASSGIPDPPISPTVELRPGDRVFFWDPTKVAGTSEAACRARVKRIHSEADVLQFGLCGPVLLDTGRLLPWDFNVVIEDPPQPRREWVQIRKMKLFTGVASNVLTLSQELKMRMDAAATAILQSHGRSSLSSGSSSSAAQESKTVVNSLPPSPRKRPASPSPSPSPAASLENGRSAKKQRSSTSVPSPLPASAPKLSKPSSSSSSSSPSLSSSLSSRKREQKESDDDSDDFESPPATPRRPKLQQQSQSQQKGKGSAAAVATGTLSASSSAKKEKAKLFASSSPVAAAALSVLSSSSPSGSSKGKRSGLTSSSSLSDSSYSSGSASKPSSGSDGSAAKLPLPPAAAAAPSASTPASAKRTVRLRTGSATRRPRKGSDDDDFEPAVLPSPLWRARLPKR